MVTFVETIWQDVRYSLMALRKNPVFAATAILTLALGIGGNTAIFTVIRAVLLKPLEYREPERLVYLSVIDPKQRYEELRFSILRYEETRKTARSYVDVGSFLGQPESVSLSGAAEAEALKAARVSANFLEVLGVRPAVGRSFLTEEDTPSGPPVAMISTRLWRRRFGADPRIAGNTATIDSTSYTIIGVLPEGFAFPFPAVDVWLTKPSEWSLLQPRYWKTLSTQYVFARLKPGMSLEQARVELDVLSRQYAATHPESSALRIGRVGFLKHRIVSNVRPMLWVLFGAVGFVLLIGCANLASLLLARASARSRELAVRAALGAGRGRLIRQLLAESMLLAAGGALAGFLLATWGLSLLPQISGFPLPRAGEIQVDAPVFGFTMMLSIATGVLFGLFPSLQASRPDLAGILREGRATYGRRSVLGISLRGLLVVGQVALSLVLLIGAALLIRSFSRLRSVDPGLQTTNVLTMKIPLPLSRYDTSQKRVTFFDELERRVAALPGVRDAGLARSLPTTPWLGTNVDVQGQPKVDPREQPSAQLQSITPGYFRALRIPLRRGREFTAHDNALGAPPTIIVNESFARRFWPSYPAGLNPVGQHMDEAADKIKSAEIVGIVADVREGGLSRKAEPEFYVPLALHAPQYAYLAVQTTGDPAQLVRAIRKEVQTIDRDQAVSDVLTMEQIFDATLGQRRLTMMLLGVFSGVAMLLAVIGLYGVIAYSVTQRTQEVGIRRALGAKRGDILRLVLMQALRLTGAGVVIGIGGAFALTRVIKTMLFEVSATDPATFVWVAVVFGVVAAGASFIPAWRALRIDPMTALRA